MMYLFAFQPWLVAETRISRLFPVHIRSIAVNFITKSRSTTRDLDARPRGQDVKIGGGKKNQMAPRLFLAFRNDLQFHAFFSKKKLIENM